MLFYVLAHYTSFFLVLLRMVAFIAASPIISLQGWPVWSKLGLAVFMSILVDPTISTNIPSPFTEPGMYILDALMESVTGIFMGFIVTLIFSVLNIAGQMIDLQIGFSAVQLFDPSSSQSSGMTATFYNLLFTLYFLGMNGLDGLMLTAMDSYKFIPIGHFYLPNGTWQMLIQLLDMVMVLALQFAAPLMVALFMTNITFAFLSRAVPQMNVYVVGLPIQLLVGLSLFVVIMPSTVYLFGQLFNLIFTQFAVMMKFIGG